MDPKSLNEVESLNQQNLDADSLTPEELEDASGGCGTFSCGTFNGTESSKPTLS